MSKHNLAQNPDDASRKYRVAFAGGCGVSWPVEQTFNAHRGVAVTGVEQWAQKNLRRLFDFTTFARKTGRENESGSP